MKEGHPAHTHPSTAKGATRHRRLAPRSSESPRPQRPKAPQALGGEGRKDRRAGRGAGEGGQELCAPGACGGLCARDGICAVAHLLYGTRTQSSLCAQYSLSLPLAVYDCFSPAGESARGLTMFLVSLAVTVCHFAVCLLVKTAPRADGASGGRETDGDGWAARAPRRPHSYRLEHASAHACTYAHTHATHTLPFI